MRTFADRESLAVPPWEPVTICAAPGRLTPHDPYPSPALLDPETADRWAASPLPPARLPEITLTWDEYWSATLAQIAPHLETASLMPGWYPTLTAEATDSVLASLWLSHAAQAQKRRMIDRLGGWFGAADA